MDKKKIYKIAISVPYYQIKEYQVKAETSSEAINIFNDGHGQLVGETEVMQNELADHEIVETEELYHG